MTMRFLISTGPMRAGVRRTFTTLSLSSSAKADDPVNTARQDWLDRMSIANSMITRCSAFAEHDKLQCRYLAAVEIDGRAVHPGGARGYQESDHIGDVLDFAEAGDAKAAAHFLAGFLLRPAGAVHLGLDAPPQPVGLDHARMDAVDLHAVVLAAIGHAFGEGGNRGIDGRADGEFFGRLAPAGAADRDDRAAPLLEQRPSGAGEPHMGEEFARVAVFPIGVGEIEEIAALGGAGIVDENVEAAELALDLLDQFCRRVRAAQIDHRDGGAAALLADRSCYLVERLFVAAGQHDVAAFGRQRRRDTAANAAARSGHQRDLAF